MKTRIDDLAPGDFICFMQEWWLVVAVGLPTHGSVIVTWLHENAVNNIRYVSHQIINGLNIRARK